MTGVLALLGALGVGAASALVPLVNAEAYALLVATRLQSWWAVLAVLSLALGQTAGKLVLFESARRGAALLRSRNLQDPGAESPSRRRWSGLATGPPVVLASAIVGLPPLAVVSLAAGAAGQRRSVFAMLCLLGRTARFAVLVLPVVWAL